MIIITAIICLTSIGFVKFVRQWEPKQFWIYSGSVLTGGAILILLCYFIGTRQDYFDEVWNYKIEKVRHYEAWNEKVSCRHPIYVTKTRTVSHTDAKGNRYTTTETYQEYVGDEHSYDVDYHPKQWTSCSEYGDVVGIDEVDYEKWKSIWGNSQWVDLNRSYHTIDGNMYESIWDGKFDTIFPTETIKKYENRVRVSNSIFNYPEVSKELKKKYFRPADAFYAGGIISYDGTPFSEEENMIMRRVNAYLGTASKIHIIFILWQGGSSDVMSDVLAAWKGPNKNELVIAIGLNGLKIVWTQCYSWCDDTTIHSLLRQDINEMEVLDFSKTKDVLLSRIPQYWKKKNFRDFNYIENPLPTWVYFLCSGLVVTMCAGGAVFVEKQRKNGYS